MVLHHQVLVLLLLVVVQQAGSYASAAETAGESQHCGGHLQACCPACKDASSPGACVRARHVVHAARCVTSMSSRACCRAARQPVPSGRKPRSNTCRAHAGCADAHPPPKRSWSWRVNRQQPRFPCSCLALLLSRTDCDQRECTGGRTCLEFGIKNPKKPNSGLFTVCLATPVRCFFAVAQGHVSRG